jgi:hypothetical protein
MCSAATGSAWPVIVAPAAAGVLLDMAARCGDGVQRLAAYEALLGLLDGAPLPLRLRLRLHFTAARTCAAFVRSHGGLAAGPPPAAPPAPTSTSAQPPP